MRNKLTTFARVYSAILFTIAFSPSLLMVINQSYDPQLSTADNVAGTIGLGVFLFFSLSIPVLLVVGLGWAVFGGLKK